MELINGGVYKSGYRDFVLMFIGMKGEEPLWGMLHLDRHAIGGMTAIDFQHDNSGNFQFTEKELTKKWNLAFWEMLDGRLRIEKIDDLSFTEYPIGNLEPFRKGDVDEKR